MAEGAILSQTDAARSHVLVADQTDAYGVLSVRGADRKTWLNGLVTCDLTKLRPGAAIYGLAVTPKGRVLADLVFLESDEHVVVLLPMSEVTTVAAAFEHYLVMEDVELEAAPAAYRVFSVHGPASASVLAAAVSAGALAATVDQLGLGGGIVVAPVAAAEAVTQALHQAATTAGGVFGEAAALEVLRIEQGIPRFGRDFGPTTYPQEAGLEQRAISFDKGCYLGQEVVCMLQLRGHVKRKLVSIELDDVTESIAMGAPIKSGDGQPLGEITSATTSPKHGKAIALGMVKLAFTEPGTALRVGEASAHVK